MRMGRLAFFTFLLATGCSSTPPPPPDVTTAANGDGDGDSIADVSDECISEAEDGKPPFPNDGCKADPNDGDGDRVGKADACPTQPETHNGYEDDDGCPDELPTDTKDVVAIENDELKCCAKVLFATGKATIDAASQPLLEHVAKLIKSNPSLDLIEVAGHADALGTPAQNLELTKKRAQAVVDALVALGVEPARLRAQGYGSQCPIAQGTDAASREMNRRVEFKIVKQNGKETGALLGCEAAKKGAPAEPPPPKDGRST